MSSFIGRFHPLLVHLPIGILIMACLFSFLIKREKYALLKPALGIILFWGMLSAIAACITGYLLSNNGDYAETLVNQHQWAGIATALTSAVFYFFYKRNKPFTHSLWLPISLLVLIMLTGHLGGSLTHGADYLTAPLSMNPTETKITDVQEAVIFKEIIYPIIQTKCTSCHGETKQKGGLRMDKYDFILRGGKNGAVISTAHADSSHLLKRLLLPLENEKHMPPKEKPQFTVSELALLQWWISSGAPNDKKVKDMPQPLPVREALLVLQNRSEKKKTVVDIPSESVEPADESAIKQLTKLGMVILPITQNSPYLSANFVTVRDSDVAEAVALLEPLKKQLIWLKMGDKPISDSLLRTVATLTGLRKLYLNNTRITDQGLSFLKNNTQLIYLNLIKTSVTIQGVLHLKNLKNLQSLYLYQTQVTKTDFETLPKAFPHTQIDTGGYTLPFLELDTMRVKPLPIVQ